MAAYALAGEPDEARRAAEKLKKFAPDLNNEALAAQFGRSDKSKLHEGLLIALSSSDR